jgi:hypothetical protein
MAHVSLMCKLIKRKIVDHWQKRQAFWDCENGVRSQSFAYFYDHGRMLIPQFQLTLCAETLKSIKNELKKRGVNLDFCVSCVQFNNLINKKTIARRNGRDPFFIYYKGIHDWRFASSRLYKTTETMEPMMYAVF